MTGALELVSGIRARRRVAARDWILTVGALTVLLAIVLIMPPDIADRFTGDKGVEGMLTSPIIVVGVLGAGRSSWACCSRSPPRRCAPCAGSRAPGSGGAAS